jgi:hypothetical protein
VSVSCTVPQDGETEVAGVNHCSLYPYIHLFLHPSTNLQFIHPCFTVHETILHQCSIRSTILRQYVICPTILRQCLICSNILRQCVISSTILRQFIIRSTILRQCIIRSTTFPSQLSTVSAKGLPADPISHPYTLHPPCPVRSNVQRSSTTS